MNIKAQDPTAHKPKRMKVSRACYTCRVKKIKCDGIAPVCMQCKARQRPCSFSGDVSNEITSMNPPYPLSPTLTAQHKDQLISTQGNNNNGDNNIELNIIKKEKQAMETTTHALDTLSQTWPGCEFDEQGIYSVTTVNNNNNNNNNNSNIHSHKYNNNNNGNNGNGTMSWQPSSSTTTASTASISTSQPEFPPLSFFLMNRIVQEDNHQHDFQQQNMKSPIINQHLIALYYRHRYKFLPLIPKETFYALIHKPSSHAMITPFLLNTMYAHAAQCTTSLSSDSDEYAKVAKSMIDNYLDKPHLTTIIALCLLSLYESNRHGYANSLCQSSMYSTMAFKMCYDLGLHQLQQNKYYHHDPKLNALKQRVLWCCFCLDKWISLSTNQPWIMHSNDMINMELPTSRTLDMEGIQMDRDEQNVMEYLVAFIQLGQLGESMLISTNTLSVMHIDQQLLSFLQRLPASLHWTPLPTTDSLSSPVSSLYQPIPSHPPHNPMVAQLHLIFNLLHLTLLVKPLLVNDNNLHQDILKLNNINNHHHHQPKKNNEAITLQRCATVATNITQLGCALTDQTNFIFSYRLVTLSLMLAIRVHLIQCYSIIQSKADEHFRMAKHGRLMFQRSLRSIRSLLQLRIIHGVDAFSRSLEKMLSTLTISLLPTTRHNNNNNNNTNHSHHQQLHHNITSTNLFNKPVNVTSPLSHSPLSYMNDDNSNNNNTNNNNHNHNQSNYLEGAEQSAAEILSNAFNTNHIYTSSATTTTTAPSSTSTSPTISTLSISKNNNITSTNATNNNNNDNNNDNNNINNNINSSNDNNNNNNNNASPSSSTSVTNILPHSTPSSSSSSSLTQKSRLSSPPPPTVDLATLYTPVTNNPLYSQQLQSHFGYTLSTGRQDEIWALQEQYQQQQLQLQQGKSPSHHQQQSLTMYPNALWSSSSTVENNNNNNNKRNNHNDNNHMDQPKKLSTSTTSSTTTNNALSTTNNNNNSMGSSTYKNIGLGVYASAHRHHSDVIGQHFPNNNKANPSERAVILNSHGQVVVTSNDSSVVDL
ncbi:unnamed protein product [Cunninghamella echinulata]